MDRKIELRLAPALETLAALERERGAGSFDFAFIDADKPAYDAYYESCLRLLRPGGLVALDNMLWSGNVADSRKHDADTDALRALNTDLKVPSPKDYGIAKDRYDELLPTMASQALASGSPANNPRVPTSDEIIDLYRRMYS